MQLPRRITFTGTTTNEILELLRIAGCEVTERSSPVLDEATGRYLLPLKITHCGVSPFAGPLLAWEPGSEDASLLWVPSGHVASLLSMLTGGILGQASSEVQERNRAVDRAQSTLLDALRSESTDMGVDADGVWKTAFRQWPDD